MNIGLLLRICAPGSFSVKWNTSTRKPILAVAKTIVLPLETL